MVSEVDIEGLEDDTPDVAPVAEPEPLTGKEKAGVSLTWGIIAVLVLFLLVILGIFVWGESGYFKNLNDLAMLKGLNDLANLNGITTEKLAEINKLVSTLESQHASFRIFWFDTLQLILLNVLFPTLTALLGYVFGTSRNKN